jgi:hypothetical protein
MTAHEIINYLEILALAVCAAAGGLWYLTRNEDANREQDARAYEESRLYPD